MSEEVTSNRYSALIEKVFADSYSEGETEVPFKRTDLNKAASELNIETPKNLGDVVYSMRYRTSMPDTIVNIQSEGLEWRIEGAGRGKYVFRLVKINRILPDLSIEPVRIPDATPGVVSACALSDEQALLAKIRYNRIVDLFLGIVSYSLQSHLRTTVRGIGQIEIDELYVGLDSKGRQYILPIQAKGRRDQLSSVQARQDVEWCMHGFPEHTCRPTSAQFLSDNLDIMD